MTDEAKLIVNTLRECAVATLCSKCVVLCEDNECMFTSAAKLIESLAAELEQVKRERDAAVEGLKLWNCFSCKNAGYAHSEICASCVYNRVRLAKGYVSGRNRYEWRGVKEATKA